MSAVLKPTDDLMQAVHEILGVVPTPRITKQLAVEKAILEFNPDCIEAWEVVCSVLCALGRRYTADRLMVVNEEAEALKVALEEAQPQEITKEDLRFDDSRWCNANE